MIEKFIKVAQSQIGYKEGKNNDTKYGKWYGMNFNPWCAMFVSWCANQAGMLGKQIPKFASCPTGYKWFNNKKLIVKTPKRGYLGFVMRKKKDGTLNADHVFIVEKVSGNTITTIEGNLSDKVCRNTRKNSTLLHFAKIEEPNEWTTGIYKLLYTKAWRKTHSLGNNIYKFIKAGTDVRINEIYKEGTRVWGRCGAYWFVLCNKDGKKQATKIG